MILAVVSAKNEIENQIVMDMVKEADPAGQRTMGKSTLVYIGQLCTKGICPDSWDPVPVDTTHCERHWKHPIHR